jgi:hypothetical protein
MTKIRLKKLLCFFEDDQPGWLGEVKTDKQWLTVTGVHPHAETAMLVLLEYVANVVWEDPVTEETHRSVVSGDHDGR